MTVGYPDYQRLTRSGGYLLYGVSNVSPPYGVVLFQGYVGNFAYLTLGLNVNSSTDYMKVVINYFTDSTFTVNVGFRYVIRGGSEFSVTQYANLSEWAQIYYFTKSGNAMPMLSFVLYGSDSPGNQAQLVSNDVPIYQSNSSIAAGATPTAITQHVQPGNGLLSVSSVVTPWYCELQYYDYGSGAFILLVHIDQTISASGGVFPVGLPDVPIQLALHNGSAAAGFIRLSLVSTI